MPRKTVLFITPPYHCGVVEVAGSWVPLTFVYLAEAARKAGYEPIIYDAMTKRHCHEDIQARIRQEAPAVVATSAYTSTYPDAMEVMSTAKEVDPSIITIIGGVHPTFQYEEALNQGCCDYVVRGEGEETLRELLSAIGQGLDVSGVRGLAYKDGHKVVVTQKRAFIEDLDTLGAAWDLLDWEDYSYFVIPGGKLGSVSTSRGCDHSCTFCSQQKFWERSWRGRRPEAVVEEMEMLNRKYGVNVVLFPDEYPTRDSQRWERLLDLLIERNMGTYVLLETRPEDIVRDRDILWKYRKAGVVHIYIGVEATNQETLDLIKKEVDVQIGVEAIRLIAEHGMISETSFILGFPHETKESIKRTLELSRHYNPDFAHYLALAPWPYAEMYDEMRPFIEVHDFRKYNLVDPVIKPKSMSLKDLDRAIIECYQKFYMGKLKETITMPDGFRKKYLLSSMKLIMNSSFIVEKLGSLGVMPPKMAALMGKLDKADRRYAKDEERFVSKVRSSVRVEAPASEVFAFVSDPNRWIEFIPGLEEVTDVSDEKLGEGSTFKWLFRVGKLGLRGEGHVAEFTHGRMLSLQMHSFMPMRNWIRVRNEGAATVLSVEVGYLTGSKAISFLFRMVMKFVNPGQSEVILGNIKEGVEGAKNTRCAM